MIEFTIGRFKDYLYTKLRIFPIFILFLEMYPCLVPETKSIRSLWTNKTGYLSRMVK